MKGIKEMQLYPYSNALSLPACTEGALEWMVDAAEAKKQRPWLSGVSFAVVVATVSVVSRTRYGAAFWKLPMGKRVRAYALGAMIATPMNLGLMEINRRTV